MIVEHRSHLPVTPEAAYAWHARPGAFERLAPPWERVRLREPHPGLAEGARVTLDVGLGPLRRTWVARHEAVRPGRGFVDVQEEGPFARWRHHHLFEPAGGGCELVDRVELELPGGPAGELLEPFVRRRLVRTLRYRHRVVAGDLALHARYAGPRLRVAISGASGLIGSALAAVLTTGGHEVLRLVRRAAGPGEARWDPAGGTLDPEALAGCDAVIHLAGASIAGRRWSDAQMRRIRESRTGGTALLAGAAARASRRPRVLVSASAVGLYGDRGDDVLSEASAPGEGFLPEVGLAWEAAAGPARAAGIRTVHPRFGLVLSPAGGLLDRVLLPFRLGVGGPIGDGRHWMSWIGIDDVAGAVLHALATEDLEGPVNVVAPEPVRNAEFGRVLGRVLRRPAVLPVPALALRLAFGRLADEALLASTRVIPEALEASGYAFRHRDLEAALRHLLGRGAR
jgi:uncharacterized protein